MPNMTSQPANVQASSANAAAANNISLPGVAGQMGYLCGFAVCGGGATGAAAITVTVGGIATTMNFAIEVPAGAGLAISPLIVNFFPPIPSSGRNTAITLSVPSFGAGNTAASASLWGYYDL